MNTHGKAHSITRRLRAVSARATSVRFRRWNWFHEKRIEFGVQSLTSRHGFTFANFRGEYTPYCGDQIICQSRLVYERICSERVREGQTVLGRIVEAKQYDLGGRCALTDLVGRFESIHFGHNQVQNNDIRVQYASLIDGLPPVFRFTTDYYRILSEKRPQGPAHCLVVVHHLDTP